MGARLLITVGVLIYALVVPILEINHTHVFNPEWPPHARLHEVWQLATNCGIGVLSLWLAWARGEIRMASLLNLLVMGGFLFAFAIQDLYGGSMVLIEGEPERAVLGLNLGVVGALVAIVASLLAWLLDRRRRTVP